MQVQQLISSELSLKLIKPKFFQNYQLIRFKKFCYLRQLNVYNKRKAHRPMRFLI